jgi:uncharacterized phage protein (TIGR01671 family)
MTDEQRKDVTGMREILFRGKRVNDGKWVYGNYAFTDNDGKQHFIYQNNAFEYAVIPETVGQYTGLTDKNGKRIFEGDICQTKGYKLIDEKPFEIVWNDYYSGWFWQDIEVSRETDTLTKTVAELTEVIGNIHDNPKLIGGGEDA